MAREKQPKDSALENTRQMLDELDALMERMLALPVNDLEEPAPAPCQVVRMPTMSATLTVLDAPDVEATAPPSPPAQPAPARTKPFVEKTPNYTAEVEPVPPTQEWPASKQQAMPIPEEGIPPPITNLSLTFLTSPMPVPVPQVRPIKVHRRSLGSLCLLPFLWFNRGFDHCTLLLGLPGRWLRGPAGRNVLGLGGLFLLALALGWLVKDWIGWTW